MNRLELRWGTGRGDISPPPRGEISSISVQTSPSCAVFSAARAHPAGNGKQCDRLLSLVGENLFFSHLQPRLCEVPSPDVVEVKPLREASESFGHCREASSSHRDRGGQYLALAKLSSECVFQSRVSFPCSIRLEAERGTRVRNTEPLPCNEQ